ncbi:hypothetical protein MY04_1857 [Flammeovirga sp. MY04]|uniref:hypothetical protein n=1 Tax=Flammeovirga sp. MY04 TaxID=1191459 RepID=UPI0013050828|nr:hypothetical protein [Flammeovirga sp. MY04]ANQ49231.2 hypothetical protein MY04_1857 [Flammeovirga sp. MY04]
MSSRFYRTLISFIVLSLFNFALVKGQEKDSVLYQKIRIKAYVPIVIGDSVMRFKKDTIIFVEKDLVNFDSTAVIRSDKFYDNLQKTLEKRRITKEISNFFLVNRNNNNTDDVNENTISEGMCFENKIIRSINYIRLNPFGGDVKDPYPERTSGLGQYANGVHNKTKEYVIRKHLLFKEGDVITDFDLSETERILRALPFIKDAEVYACEMPNSEIDIYVVTKDQWTIGASVDTYNFGDYGGGIYNSNFLGMGQYVYLGGILQPESDIPLGFDLQYRYNNISGTFIDVIGNFTDSENESIYGLATYKDFVTSATKWGGEMGYLYVRQAFGYSTSDSAFIPGVEDGQRFWKPHKYEVITTWAGRSFQIDKDKNRNITVLAGREQTLFSRRPEETSADTLYRYQDKIQYTAGLTFTQRNYRKLSYLQGFGRNEDVPHGWLFNSTIGYEQNEFLGDRPYIGFQMDYGRFTPWGFFRANYEYGQFFETKYQQKIQHFGLHYFSNLLAVRRNFVRFFLDVNMTSGSDLVPGQFLYFISDDFFSSYNIDTNTKKGSRRAQLKQEAVWFTPWYFYGFKFAFYQNIELGVLLGEKENSISKDELFTGFGGGIRTRNENLVFNTISLDIKLYPNSPEGRTPYQITFSTEIQLPIIDFKPTKPRMVPFE